MVATLDGLWEQDGNRKVLEIKTTTRKWEGYLPDYWKIQGIQQAICADVNQILWAVFDPSMILHIHVQNVTSKEMAEHISAVENWLNSIELGITPTGVVWSYESVQTRFQQSANSTSNIDPTHKELFDQLRHVRSELDSYKKLEDALKARICELMGDSDTAVMNGSTVATWKTQVRETFDSKAFRVAYPELANEFTKETTTRVFLLKGEK
jgi:hypothetical protein